MVYVQKCSEIKHTHLELFLKRGFEAPEGTCKSEKNTIFSHHEPRFNFVKRVKNHMGNVTLTNTMRKNQRKYKFFIISFLFIYIFRVLNVTGAGYADCNGLYTISNQTSIWDSKVNKQVYGTVR